jgi:hypothetical protein
VTPVAGELYQTVGLGFANKVIDSAFNDFIKEVVPQYPVTEILAKRGSVHLLRTTAADPLREADQVFRIRFDETGELGFLPEVLQAFDLSCPLEKGRRYTDSSTTSLDPLFRSGLSWVEPPSG